MPKFDYGRWYDENKDKVSRKRKLKYRLDKKFRDERKDYSKEYYEKNVKKGPRSIIVIKGQKYLTIGGLAKVINRGEQTIREYHAKGVLPETMRGNSRGWRVYNMPHARIVRDAFSKFDNQELDSLKEVKKYIHERW